MFEEVDFHLWERGCPQCLDFYDKNFPVVRNLNKQHQDRNNESSWDALIFDVSQQNEDAKNDVLQLLGFVSTKIQEEKRELEAAALTNTASGQKNAANSVDSFPSFVLESVHFDSKKGLVISIIALKSSIFPLDLSTAICLPDGTSYTASVSQIENAGKNEIVFAIPIDPQDDVFSAKVKQFFRELSNISVSIQLPDVLKYPTLLVSQKGKNI
jgi:hypothetical protein